MHIPIAYLVYLQGIRAKFTHECHRVKVLILGWSCLKLEGIRVINGDLNFIYSVVFRNANISWEDVQTYTQTNRHTYIHTYIQTDRQTNATKTLPPNTSLILALLLNSWAQYSTVFYCCVLCAAHITRKRFATREHAPANLW